MKTKGKTLMRLADALHFSERALLASVRRTLLITTAIAIGIAAVVILASLSDSARNFVRQEFNSLGTNLIVIMPGKTETAGQMPPLVGSTPAELTLADAMALKRLRHVKNMAPVIIGSAPASYAGLEREITVIGSTDALLPVRNLKLARGSFLSLRDDSRSSSVVVIGHQLRRELFGSKKALGQWLRLNDRRYRVTGVLAPLGESLGIDVGELAIISVADAQSLFNTRSLFRILLQATSRDSIEKLKISAAALLQKRHHGKEDVTLITQQAIVSTFDDIFRSLGYAVTGIAAISLGVAGILIMNVMLIAVSQRRREIGLLKALGSTSKHIHMLFLVDALLLSLSGALLGLALGFAVIGMLHLLYPALPLAVPPWAVFSALGIALGTGLLFGTLPARQASRLDPILALTGRQAE